MVRVRMSSSPQNLLGEFSLRPQIKSACSPVRLSSYSVGHRIYAYTCSLLIYLHSNRIYTSAASSRSSDTTTSGKRGVITHLNGAGALPSERRENIAVSLSRRPPGLVGKVYVHDKTVIHERVWVGDDLFPSFVARLADVQSPEHGSDADEKSLVRKMHADADPGA